MGGGSAHWRIQPSREAAHWGLGRAHWIVQCPPSPLRIGKYFRETAHTSGVGGWSSGFHIGQSVVPIGLSKGRKYVWGSAISFTSQGGVEPSQSSPIHRRTKPPTGLQRIARSATSSWNLTRSIWLVVALLMASALEIDWASKVQQEFANG